MRLLILGVLAVATATTASAQTAPAPAMPTVADAKVHEDLRAMKDRLVAALNAKRPDAVLAEVTPDVRLTTMDSVLSKGPAGTRAYYDRMMSGANRVVDQMSLTAAPDERSLLYAGNTVAITTGTARAHFRLTGGRELDVPLRWTATSVNQGGVWKVAAAQFGADMFDNPLVAETKRLTIWLMVAAGVVGLLLGWFLGRRKRRA